MQEQEQLHNAEMNKWQSVLQIAVDLLRKVSVVCKEIVNNGRAEELELLGLNSGEGQGEDLDGDSLLNAADDLLRHKEF